jgi:hypothetical protein
MAGERFIDHGRYAFHLRRFLDLFPRERLLLLVYEDIAHDPQKQLERLSRHLGHLGRVEPPLAERVKDKSTAIVPPSLRRALTPLRPLLDPFRDNPVLCRLRNALAREMKYPPLTPDLASRLRDHFADDVAAVEDLLGRRLPEWSPRAEGGSGHRPRAAVSQAMLRG